MPGMIFVDVEAGDNCPYSIQQVFSALNEARPVRQVRLYDRGDKDGAVFDISAWGEDGPSAALGVAVEDSGQGRAFLVFGGEGGIRFRPSGSTVDWSITAQDQWGESHMLLTDEGDLVWA